MDNFNEIQELALTDSDAKVRAKAIEGGGLTPEQLERALVDDYMIVRLSAAKHGDLSAAQIERALADDAWSVRKVIVDAGGLTPEQLERALVDEYVDIRKSAIESCALSATQVEQALTDGNQDVRLLGVKLGVCLTPEQIERALNDPCEDIRLHAMTLGNMSFSQIRHAYAEDNKDRDILCIMWDRDRPRQLVQAIEICRNKMIEQVWEKFGFTVSENSIDDLLPGRKRRNKLFTGKILAIDLEEHLALQSIGGGEAILHNFSDLDKTPVVGAVATVTYDKDGHGAYVVTPRLLECSSAGVANLTDDAASTASQADVQLPKTGFHLACEELAARNRAVLI